MKPQAFIFIGRSGCGKGTQVQLLTDVLSRHDTVNRILKIETGHNLRQFIQGETFTQKKTADIYKAGGLVPEFLSVRMWVDPLVEEYDGNQHLIFDGTPRKVHEAGVLHSIFDFYGLDTLWVLNIAISDQESLKRLLLRKRLDDSEDDIKKRLAWYETDVVPTIEYYKNNSNYNFLDIDGERPIDEIHADIVKRLGLE